MLRDLSSLFWKSLLSFTGPVGDVPGRFRTCDVFTEVETDVRVSKMRAVVSRCLIPHARDANSSRVALKIKILLCLIIRLYELCNMKLATSEELVTAVISPVLEGMNGTVRYEISNLTVMNSGCKCHLPLSKLHTW